MNDTSLEDFERRWHELAVESTRSQEPALARALEENAHIVLVAEDADIRDVVFLLDAADAAGRPICQLDLEGWEPGTPLGRFVRFREARAHRAEPAEEPIFEQPTSLELATLVALGGQPDEAADPADTLEEHLAQLVSERMIVTLPFDGSVPEPVLSRLRRVEGLAVVERRREPMPARRFYADAVHLELPPLDGFDAGSEPVLLALRERVSATDPEGEHRLLDALALLAEGRGPAPLEPIFELLLADGETRAAADRIEDAIDLVDDVLVDELGLLVDLQFLHPGFAHGLYDFANPLLRMAFLDAGAPPHNRTIRTLARRIGLRQRGPAALIGRMAMGATTGDTRAELLARCRRRLTFHVGEDTSVDFERAFEDGAVETEDLWQLAVQPGWPAELRHRALDAWRRHDESAGNARLGDYHRLLAEILRLEGKPSEALESATRALEISGANHGPKSVPFLSAQHQCAVLLADLGQKELALDQMQMVVELGTEILPKNDPKLPMLIGDLGRALLERGELRKARDQWQRAVEVSAEIHGANHPNVARRRNNLAGLLMEVGELEEARQQIELSLPVFYRHFGETAPETLLGRHNLAAITAELGDLRGAKVQLRELLDLERKLHAGRPEMLSTLTRLASLEVTDDPEAARALYEEALAIAHPIFGEGHPAIEGIRSALIGLR